VCQINLSQPEKASLKCGRVISEPQMGIFPDANRRFQSLFFLIGQTKTRPESTIDNADSIRG
jgi:hypothetical protein